ncbi:superoxide dismutase [uncultured Brevibacillus sp.]|uniref:superoxide dismutase n=1 Tax=uncultured Brevibacillus sp. TaxID=169970 RepID=UPI002592A894|nr:superoxide dismutase [uncultured Brevibacillus sp.]
MDEQTKHLLDWSQWGRQWIEHLRKSKPLGRELERHLHKFEETFTQIGKKASLLDANKNDEELPALLFKAEEVQKQFHHFLRLAQLQEEELPEETTTASEAQPAQSVPSIQEPEPIPEVINDRIIAIPTPIAYPSVREPVRVARPVGVGRHTLPPLPYAYNALEPYIDEATMHIHHDKLHQKYVDDLNTAERKLAEARNSGNFDLIRHWERELAFNGAGHYLHTIFWPSMSPNGGGEPSGELAEAINRSFGNYDAFQKQFSQAAEKVEGPGWAILVWSPRAQHLEILTAEKHQNLSQWDVVPLLVLDVWEHAYFLLYQNQRDKYVGGWWNIVNWPYVMERYTQARKLRWEPH